MARVTTSTRTSYLLVLAAAVCCYAALGAVVRIIPSYVGSTLGRSAVAVGLAVGAPALTAVVTRPIGGRLGDRLGPRPIVIGGAVVTAVGALPMFVESYPVFLCSRLLVGVGEGAMMSASVLWLLRLAPADRRGRTLGHIGLANYAGLTLGPLVADAVKSVDAVFVAAAVLPLVGLLASSSARSGRAPEQHPAERRSTGQILLVLLGPGIGLLLVNVGYAALLTFGPAAIGAAAVAVLPIYAVTVIVVRTIWGSLPDRLGGARMLTIAAPTAAAGLVMAALLAPAAALAGVAVLGIGQALAVPALGLLAIGRVPEDQHGVASGVFFSWFDAGVGLGAPFAGLVAGLTDASGALVAAAVAVLLAPLAASDLLRRRSPSPQPSRSAGARPRSDGRRRSTGSASRRRSSQAP
jgi:MFS family permease